MLPPFRKKLLNHLKCIPLKQKILLIVRRMEALFFTDLRIGAQQFIRRNTIQLTQCDKMAERQLIGTSLISGIHGLRRSKILGNIFLLHIMVFSEITQLLHYLLHTVHRLSALQCTKVKIFTIDFSKYLY